MYQEMLLFVENLLKGKQGGKSKNKIAIDYDRFAHTKRVLKWVKYLCNELNVSFDRENLARFALKFCGRFCHYG